MAITAETRNDIIELVVTSLNQAPGTTLLTELVAIVDAGGSLADVSAHLTASAAYKAIYPSFQTAEEFAAEWLSNLVPEASADALAEAKSVAIGLINGGASQADLMLEAQAFLSALSETDASFGSSAANWNNRVEVATTHTITNETAAPDTAILSFVTSDDASVTTAVESLATAAAVPGQTYSLTTGLDTLTGGATNDTFSAIDADAISGAPTTTINAGDSINAGAGTDKLSIAVSRATPGAATSAQVSSSTVEEVALYNNAGAQYTVDTTLMTGLTDLYVIAGTGDAVFTGVNSSPNVHLTSASNDVTVTNAATVGLGDADAVTIALNGAAATANAQLTYNDIETFNVVSTGAATGTSTTTMTLTSDQLETVNVSGSAAAKISATMTGASASSQTGTLDASGMTGALVATVGAGASGKLSVTGGSGADRLTVNGGAMNTDLTIDGGDGIDTLVVTSAAYNKNSTTGQAGDGVTNMEVLLVSGGSADARAFSNNTFSSYIGTGATAITGLGTDAATLTMLTTGNKSLARATDGAADEATVTFASAGNEFTVGTLGVANEETLTINSGSATTGGSANTISSLTGTDLTTLTLAGDRDLTISAITGTGLATVDASGLSGLGTQLVISAANSTADMTVTGAAGVETSSTEVMNNITTGAGDDTITTGDYNDTINAGEGDNTIVAGDGDNVVTTGRGDDTITVGDGDNTITSTNGDNTVTAGDGDNTITLSGNGDDTVTVGGTTTSTTVFDTNTVNLGGGDDTYVGGAGKDIVTLGTGDDTVDTGAGADTIIMTDYDDDDSINGGAGSDILYRDALPTTGAYAAAADFVDISTDSSPAITGVETVYLQQTVAAANDGESTKEVIDFTNSSGITTLYLDVVDAAETNDDAVLDLKNLDAANLVVSDTSGEAVALLDVDGTGQSSLTITFDDWNSSTADAVDLEVTDVDALTLTARTTQTVSGVTTALTMTSIDDVTADGVESLTVNLAGVAKASYSAAFTVDDISADTADTMTFSVGTYSTLAVGAVTNTGANVDALTLTATDDSDLNIESIVMTGADIPVATITVGIGAELENASNTPLTITADTITAATISVGAAAQFRANLDFGGVTTLTADSGSTVDIDALGQDAETGSFTLSGRGTLTNDIAVDGTTTLKMTGWTDAASTDFIIDGTASEKLTFLGNTLYSASVQGGAGNDSVTSGDGADEISLGAGLDTVNAGDGNDRVGAEGGTQTLAVTYGDNDAIVVTVNGVNTASVTAANDDATTAGLIVAAINATSATSFATAAVGGTNDVVISYDHYFTGATVATDNGGADGTPTLSAGTATGYSDAGDDVINLGDGVDYVYYNAGADKINTGGNDSDADIIYFQSDAADIASTWTDTAAGSTVDVSGAVIITGYTLDKLDLASSAGDFAAVNTAVETMVTSNDAIGNNDDVDLYTGVYDAATGLFTSAATADATDLLLVYDNAVSGTPDFSAIVLVGGVNSDGELMGVTEASGVLTFGAWA